MSLRTTRTLATLELSAATYNEIHTKLKAAGYDQAFLENGMIDMHGIGITKVARKPFPRRGRILTGKELRHAADNGTPVFYEEEYHDPNEKGFYGETRLEKAPRGYYIGDSDIQPDEFADDEVVMRSFPEGTYTVYEVVGQTYK